MRVLSVPGGIPQTAEEPTGGARCVHEPFLRAHDGLNEQRLETRRHMEALRNSRLGIRIYAGHGSKRRQGLHLKERAPPKGIEMTYTPLYVMHASGGRHVARRFARKLARRCPLFSGSGPARCNVCIAHDTDPFGTNPFGTDRFRHRSISARALSVQTFSGRALSA